MQGNVTVDKSILYADKPVYFPWRPRLWLAARNLMLYQAIAQGLALSWALLTPGTAGTQPVIWCEYPCLGGHLIFGVANSGGW
jgi:hypothetical protein